MYPDFGPSGAANPAHSETIEGDEAVEVARLREANRQLEAEVNRLAALARASRESAALQAARASSLLGWAARNERTLQELYASTFWAVTGPLRLGARLIGGGMGGRRGMLRRIAGLAARRGWKAAATQGVAHLKRNGARVAGRLGARLRQRTVAIASVSGEELVFARPIERAARHILAPRVLIVAELSVPQCAKYRVWQKRELLQNVGVAATVTDWRDLAASRSALQLCALVIFYRVPGTAEVLDLIAEARRLGVASWWEVDDVIFDEAIYRGNRNLETLDPGLRESLLAGARLYRAGMLACDKAIASTPHLAQAMREAGVPETHVIENALDRDTLEAAAALRATSRRAEPGLVRIAYGSGTKTHDIDFARVASPLARLMRSHPNLRLRIVGELTLPPALEAFETQIERFEAKDFRTWLALLAGSDIAIAPLEDTRFNDAKSNIKYLEAAVLALPCVCSPRAAFRDVVVHGQNGLLADSEDEWHAALGSLVRDPLLRRGLGDAALSTVLDRYAPAAIARRQVGPLVTGLDGRTTPRLRVLSANIFFWPRSFGGATIVAEEVADRLHARPDAEVFVFTSHRSETEGEYGLRRYDRDGLSIVSVGLPAIPDEIGSFDNPAIGERFTDVLRAVEPDVVHIHSVQGLSASLLTACRALRIPYVVTVHDAWWLCLRQFMVREDGRYCHQTRIDMNLCRACVPGAGYLQRRFDLLMDALRGAALVLSPSTAHGALYLANGVEPDRLRVQPNGIRMPARPRPRRRHPGQALRFGYVGGTAPVKGYGLLRRAFEGLARDDWELVLIDNTLNLGFASIDVGDWKTRGRITVEPAYSQETMDRFFARIDVLLFPSQWRESFGLTVREALARDVWVISTDCGGPVEDIVDGVNGTIVPMDGRAEPLRAAILDLLDSPERFAGYSNPHKARLKSFVQQADELFGLLSEAATRPA